jgi:hypothetical protein
MDDLGTPETPKVLDTLIDSFPSCPILALYLSRRYKGRPRLSAPTWRNISVQQRDYVLHACQQEASGCTPSSRIINMKIPSSPPRYPTYQRGRGCIPPICCCI